MQRTDAVQLIVRKVLLGFRTLEEGIETALEPPNQGILHPPGLAGEMRTGNHFPKLVGRVELAHT